MVLEAQDRTASSAPRITDYGEFLFFPYSGEVVIASKDAIAAFEASDVENPEYQELSKILGVLGVNIG